MAVTNPQHFIDQIPAKRWELMTGRGSLKGLSSGQEPNWVEPASPGEATPGESELGVNQLAISTSQGNEAINISEKVNDESEQRDVNENKIIHGKIQRLGEFVDTDAVCLPPSITMRAISLTSSNSWHPPNFSSHVERTKKWELIVLNLQILPSAHEPKKASTW